MELACYLFILPWTQRFEIRTPLTRSNCLLEKIKGPAFGTAEKKGGISDTKPDGLRGDAVAIRTPIRTF